MISFLIIFFLEFDSRKFNTDLKKNTIYIFGEKVSLCIPQEIKKNIDMMNNLIYLNGPRRLRTKTITISIYSHFLQTSSKHKIAL